MNIIAQKCLLKVLTLDQELEDSPMFFWIVFLCLSLRPQSQTTAAAWYTLLPAHRRTPPRGHSHTGPDEAAAILNGPLLNLVQARRTWPSMPGRCT